jgi:type I restriction enzyme, R subunit
MPTEADTCRTYILPKLHAAGWEDDFITEQRVIAPGRIVARFASTRCKPGSMR